jgi:primosomal protein N' (replication factor Y)
VKRGVLASESILPPVRVRPRVVRTAQLAVSPAMAEAALSSLGKTAATQQRRAKALRYLITIPQPINVSWVYAQSRCTLEDLEELAERQLITLQETEIWRDPVRQLGSQRPLRPDVVFTAEQQAAWAAIERGLQEAAAGAGTRTLLLQGVTGSGKTELYIRAACEAVARGRQAIILVPEIALTAQTVERFLERFPGQTGLIHSRLSEGERYDTWRRARLGLLQVVIGPRSALFAPLPNIGLIVLDECHDASYYQSDPPFYNATTAAQVYAQIAGALCVLGSATPSVVQRYQAEVGRSQRLQLTQRVGPDADGGGAQELQMPPVKIVDMREELKAGNRGMLSRELREVLELVLARGEQAILFMNRRGSATYVFCRTCGTTIRCPRCDAPLTHHTSSTDALLCHRCGFVQPMPKKCPNCGNASVRAYGLGTEKVETEIQRCFPKARTLRWDWETTREKDSHQAILAYFSSGRADVLIGTQMLAKGLDLPRVTLVGMVLADVALHLPDPYAAERVFQVLTHVAGRAGRRALGGRAVLQTFEPEHYAIRAAALHDVDGFYAEESAQRRRLGYPPFAGLMRLEVRRPSTEQAERQANVVAATIRKQIKATQRTDVTIVGPAPCFYTRIAGQFRWQIVLRGAKLRDLVPARLGPDWRIEVEPASLL